MTEMVYGVAPNHSGDAIVPRWWRTVDRWSLVCVGSLYCLGLLLGLAASVALAEKTGRPPFFYVKNQAIYGGLGIVMVLFLSTLTPKQVRRIGVMGFGVAFLALISLWVVGTDHGKGAVRWLSIAGMSVQPSEFLKPCFLVLSAWLMSASQEEDGPNGVFYSLISLGIVVGLLALQPDFGQASLILVSWAVMYFVAGGSMLILSGLVGLTLAVGTFAYNVSEHVARRINGYLSADVDPRTQIGYAISAIQEGGFFGVGVGEGQVKRVLPDAHTDFIIAVAAEEYGMILVMLIIGLFLTVVVRSMLRLRDERDTFIRLAGTGLACAFGLQACINMGVAVRLLPPKGMTLPFISYGGSSIVASGITVGMLLAMTRSRPRGGLHDLLSAPRASRPAVMHPAVTQPAVMPDPEPDMSEGVSPEAPTAEVLPPSWPPQSVAPEPERGPYDAPAPDDGKGGWTPDPERADGPTEEGPTEKDQRSYGEWSHIYGQGGRP